MEKGDTQPVYIPENTMVQNEQKKDVVTRVIFKAVLKREQFGEKSTEVNPELPLKPIEGFFVFKGGNTDIENYKYNNYNKDNTTFLFSVRRMWRSTPRPLQQNIFIYIFGRVFSKRSDNLKRTILILTFLIGETKNRQNLPIFHFIKTVKCIMRYQ